MTARPLAIVTGTSRGLGRALAAALLARDHDVVGIARGPRPAQLALAGYTHVTLDLTELEALEPALEAATGRELATRTRVVLVHNAGTVEPVGPLTALGARELERSFALNVLAPILLSGFVLRRSTAHDVRIAEISSGAAHAPYAGWAAYCAGKAALAMVGRVVAAEAEAFDEHARRRIAVVSYAPHVVDTAMQAVLRSTSAARFPARERFVGLHERGELVAPERPAAELADVLARDELPARTELRFRP